MEKEIKPDELNGDPFKQDLAIVTPASLLQMAISKGTDLAQLEKLMDLQDRWEKNESRKAFVNAMTQFKANPPDIFKDTKVSFGNTNYSHATLDQVSEKIGQALSMHGLSHRWDVSQTPGNVSVTCIITHIMGHSESVMMTAPNDVSGSKNAIQSIGSTVSYLQRYSLLSASGCAVKEMDDDGRQGQAQPTPIEKTATKPVKYTDDQLRKMKNAELRKLPNTPTITQIMHDNVDKFIINFIGTDNVDMDEFNTFVFAKTGKNWLDLNVNEKDMIARMLIDGKGAKNGKK